MVLTLRKIKSASSRGVQIALKPSIARETKRVADLSTPSYLMTLLEAREYWKKEMFEDPAAFKALAVYVKTMQQDTRRAS